MSARASQVRSASRSSRPDHKPALRVVGRKKPRRLIARGRQRSSATMTIGGVIVIVALVFGILLEQVVLAQSAFRLSEQRARLQKAEERHETLLRTAARLESPARIERFARNVLGMEDPVATGVRYIVADIRPRPGTADPASSVGGLATDGESPDGGTALGGGAP